MRALSAICNFKAVPVWHSLVDVFTILIATGLIGLQASNFSHASEFNEISGLFEPSGVVQLSNGRLLAVEDEPTDPFALLAFMPNTSTFDLEVLRPSVVLHPTLNFVSDLEGVTIGPNGDVFAITSHSRKSNGKRESGRELFLRFTINDNKLIKSDVRGDLRKQLTTAYPELKASAKERNVKKRGGLNIEGLTFSSDGKTLWIGLRAPLASENAIVIGILNPHKAFDKREKFIFASLPLYLDLDGGGIRDLAYDPKLSGYLVLSQKENTKKEKPFKLWFWNGNLNTPPQRVRIQGIDKLNFTESIAPIRLNGKEKLILLNDDGNRVTGKPASYHIVDYTQLEIEHLSQ